MTWTLDERFDLPANADVFAYLRRSSPSAHDDVASALSASGRALGGVRTWCPDPQAYAFVALATRERTLFALARGSSSVVFRLPVSDAEAARADGGRPCADVGTGWMEWSAFEARDLASWCARAHALALRDENEARG